MNQNNNSTNGLYPVVGIGEWALTIFLSGIPVIGLIMLIIFAFSSNTNPSKQNFARMMLILYVAFFAFYFVLFLSGALSGLFDPSLYNTGY